MSGARSLLVGAVALLVPLCGTAQPTGATPSDAAPIGASPTGTPPPEVRRAVLAHGGVHRVALRSPSVAQWRAPHPLETRAAVAGRDVPPEAVERLDGRLLPAAHADSVFVRVYWPPGRVASDDVRAWDVTVAWGDVTGIEREVIDRPAVMRQGRRGALRGGLLGAVLGAGGAALAGASPVGAAVAGGVVLGWLGFIVTANGAEVALPPVTVPVWSARR